ncbi:hypothetical protein [Streptomyces sp.]|uniref:hypothetical protein n=1 Tax=Streptomyces sp. TaxID=1931 RepID=UPI003D6A1A2F
MLGASVTLALGFGGVMAPAAHAATPTWNDAGYTQTDLRTGAAETGAAVESTGGTAVQPPMSAASLHCWDPYRSGRVFALSCSGARYYIFADCSNNRRYAVGPLSGAKRVAIRCPYGTYAVRGGAYGY